MADTRKDTRAPISLKVRFKSASLDEFIEQYSIDVSRGGMFIKSKTPLEIGTLLKFELQLKDESRLIQGVGRVVWTREPIDAVDPAQPPGMGIKFIKMADESREVVDQVVSARGEGPSSFERGSSDPTRPGKLPSNQPAPYSDPAPLSLTRDEDVDEPTNVRHASEFLALALARAGANPQTSDEARQSADASNLRALEREESDASEQDYGGTGYAASQPPEPSVSSKFQLEPEPRASEREDTAQRIKTGRDVSTPPPVTSEAPFASSPGVASSVPQSHVSPKYPSSALPMPPTTGSSASRLYVGIGVFVLVGIGVFLAAGGLKLFQGKPHAVQPANPKGAVTPVKPQAQVQPVEVTVESVPPGAQLAINGEVKGVTPLKASLPPGEHTATFTLSGHKVEQAKLTVTPKMVPVNIELKRLEYELEVETTPPQAEASVGEVKIETPGALKLGVLEKDVTLRIFKRGFFSKVIPIKLTDFVANDHALTAKQVVELKVLKSSSSSSSRSKPPAAEPAAAPAAAPTPVPAPPAAP